MQPNNEQGGCDMDPMRVIFSWTMVLGLGFIGFSILFGSWYTVPEGYHGVIARNGKVVGIAEPGLHFKLPVFDSVYDMSIQTQKAEFKKITSYSKDIQLSESAVAVNYRLKPDYVQTIYSEVGTGYADRIMFGRLEKRFKEVFGKFSAADIVGQRDILSNQIEEQINADMAPFGVIVEDLQIINIDFSDSYEAAVEATARAEAEVKKARQELERVRVDSERQVAEAQARAKATIEAANAEAYATEKRGAAEATAIAARGKALRDNPELIKLITAEKWNGVLPQTMVPGSAVPFIEVK